MKFKVGDKIVALPGIYFGRGFWDSKMPPYSVGTITGKTEDDFECVFPALVNDNSEGIQWFTPEYHAKFVVLEEIYNSPLYKALNE